MQRRIQNVGRGFIRGVCGTSVPKWYQRQFPGKVSGDFVPKKLVLLCILRRTVKKAKEYFVKFALQTAFLYSEGVRPNPTNPRGSATEMCSSKKTRADHIYRGQLVEPAEQFVEHANHLGGRAVLTQRRETRHVGHQHAASHA